MPNSGRWPSGHHCTRFIKGSDTVKRTFAELNEAWNLVEGKHDIYTIHLNEEVEQSEAWINELQELYSEAAAMQAQYVNDQIQ